MVSLLEHIQTTCYQNREYKNEYKQSHHLQNQLQDFVTYLQCDRDNKYNGTHIILVLNVSIQ